MSEMIERVAKAICLAELPSDAKWELCVPAAIAAIEAMREPTNAMIKALDKADYDMRQQGFSGVDATGCWVIMIDEALK